MLTWPVLIGEGMGDVELVLYLKLYGNSLIYEVNTKADIKAHGGEGHG